MCISLHCRFLRCILPRGRCLHLHGVHERRIHRQDLCWRCPRRRASKGHSRHCSGIEIAQGRPQHHPPRRQAHQHPCQHTRTGQDLRLWRFRKPCCQYSQDQHRLSVIHGSRADIRWRCRTGWCKPWRRNLQRAVRYLVTRPFNHRVRAGQIPLLAGDVRQHLQPAFRKSSSRLAILNL